MNSLLAEIILLRNDIGLNKWILCFFFFLGGGVEDFPRGSNILVPTSNEQFNFPVMHKIQT